MAFKRDDTSAFFSFAAHERPIMRETHARSKTQIGAKCLRPVPPPTFGPSTTPAFASAVPLQAAVAAYHRSHCPVRS